MLKRSRNPEPGMWISTRSREHKQSLMAFFLLLIELIAYGFVARHGDGTSVCDDVRNNAVVFRVICRIGQFPLLVAIVLR